MDRPPRTAPEVAARRLLAADFLDLTLLSLPAPERAAEQVLAERFELRVELGRGAAGVVWRAFDHRTQREVALKLLSRGGGELSARLEREGQLAATLDHPNLVRIHDAGCSSEGPYLVYELVRGATSLEEALPQLSWAERLARLEEIAAALAHAHARGVVHRDLKAANVLLDEEGHARVTDFGVGWSPDLESLTASGVAVGTPVVMAPEQILGGEGSRGAGVDVWALGVLLYRCATDRYPFEGEDLVTLASAIVNGRRESLRKAAPTLPPSIAAIGERCLQVDSSERYPDGAALLTALREARTAATGPREPTRRTLWPQVALLALACVLGVGILGALGQRPAPRPSATPRATASRNSPVVTQTAILSPSLRPPLVESPTPAVSQAPSPAVSQTPASAVSQAPSHSASQGIVGYLERCDDRGQVWGWAASPSALEEPLEVLLIVAEPSGREVAQVEGKATQRRQDVLRVRGFAKGNHGFRLDLPARLRDGQPYLLRAFARPPSGGALIELQKSPLALRLPLPVRRGDAELLSDPDFEEGLSLRDEGGPETGWRKLPREAGGPAAIALGEERGAPTWRVLLEAGGGEFELDLNALKAAKPQALSLRSPLQTPPASAEISSLRLQLEFQTWNLRGAGDLSFGVQLVARGPRGAEVECGIHLSTRGEVVPRAGFAAWTPAPRSRSWTRVDRDLLPLLREAGQAAGLDEEAIATLRPSELRLGWEARGRVAGGARCANISMSVVPK